jgi:hypothetical protein
MKYRKSKESRNVTLEIMTAWTTLIILDNYFYTIKSEKQKKQEVSKDKNKKRQLQIF